MATIHLAIIIPFLAALLIPLISRRIRFHLGWLVLSVPVILFLLLIQYIPSIAEGQTYFYSVRWIPSYNVHFSTFLDGLSFIFGLIITAMGVLVVLYSIYYLSREEALSHFYIYLLLFMGGMLGVVFSDHLLLLYAFWEVTSISSFLLIAFWYHRKMSRQSAQKSLLITVSGGVAMLAGFIMVYQMTGTMSIREMVALLMGDAAQNISHHPLFIPAMLLILLGAFTKSAQFPFHIWLPRAMEAPTPVSAYLHSATMVKAGIYLVARLTPIFGEDGLWFLLVTTTGLVTLFWGSFTAVRQIDLKALLAYSTVSQLGLILSLLGIGSLAVYLDDDPQSIIFTQAAFASLFHLVNHATFKGALFMMVGIVDLEVGTRDVRRLGGLISFMPVTFTIALVGSFSMAGLPPFNGFLSKEMFFNAVLKVKELSIFSMDLWGFLIPLLAWVASIFTFVYSMIIVFQTFFGSYHPDRLEHEAREAPLGMLVAPLFLSALAVGLFFFPNGLGQYLLQPAMGNIFPALANGGGLQYTIHHWHGLDGALWMTLGVIILGTFLYKWKTWRGVYKWFPPRFSLDNVFETALAFMERGASFLTRTYMTGLLRDYFAYIFLFLLLTAGGAFLWTGAFQAHFLRDAPVDLYEVSLVLVMMAAALAIPFVHSRITAVILNGVLGFAVSFFFVLFRAPDLALTQLVVEMVTTVLFLLCFYYLPQWKKETISLRTRLSHLILSIGVGALFMAIALSVKSGPLFESISPYFEQARELAGSDNIVNAIIGDFRAFDTMLEVVVLLIAGIGVYGLMKVRDARKGESHVEKQ